MELEYNDLYKRNGDILFLQGCYIKIFLLEELKEEIVRRKATFKSDSILIKMTANWLNCHDVI